MSEIFTALFTVLRARAERVRDLHRSEERDVGAFSIELALLVAALVVIAGIVIAIVTAKAQQKANQIG
jgi:ABC-type Fe3+ transport system permease subunit